MLDSILKLEGVTVLSKEHQKSISGGDSCAYFLPPSPSSNGYSVVWHGISASSAESSVEGIAGAHWCCDSCDSASWFEESPSSNSLHFYT